MACYLSTPVWKNKTNLNRNSKVRVVSAMQFIPKFLHILPNWYDLDRTLVGAKSPVSIVDGEFLIEENYLESAGLEIGIRIFFGNTYT